MNTINLASAIDLDGLRPRRAVRSSISASRPRPSIDRRAAASTTSRDEIETALLQLRAAAASATRSRSTRDDSVDERRAEDPLHRVSAELSCDPLDVPVEFVAEVELDSGKISINRL